MKRRHRRGFLVVAEEFQSPALQRSRLFVYRQVDVPRVGD
jgi:hypothetical protein